MTRRPRLVTIDVDELRRLHHHCERLCRLAGVTVVGPHSLRVRVALPLRVSA